MMASHRPAWMLAILIAASHLHTSVAQTDSQPGIAGDLLQASSELARQQSAYEQQIAELESEFGPLDFRLIEPLRGLSELFRQKGNTAELQSTLSRRRQLLRVSEGPTTLNQIPVIAEQIRLDALRGEWGVVTEHYEAIFQLHLQQSNANPEALLSSLNDIRAWHLLAMHLDVPERRSQHILASREVQNRLFGWANQLYEENSMELVPWLYSFASESYRITNFLSAEGLLPDDQDNFLARSSTLDLIYRIQAIAEARANPEAQAMAMIYLADFQLLRREPTQSSFGGRVQANGRGVADQTYRRAMSMLEEAGVEQSRIDEFFARPMPLPVPGFHWSIDSALAQRTAQGYHAASMAEGEPPGRGDFHIGQFAWTEFLPKAKLEEAPGLAELVAINRGSARLRFRINSVGIARSARVVKAEPDNSQIKSAVRDIVSVLQFRPAFIDGRWRPMRNVTLDIKLPPVVQ